MSGIVSNLFGGGEAAAAAESPAGESSKPSRVAAFHSSQRWRLHFDSCKQLNKLMVIDFSATCGPCKFMEPVFDEMSTKFQDVEFVKIDVDELSDVSREFAVQAIPTFVLLKQGKEVERVIGGTKDELEKKILSHREDDMTTGAITQIRQIHTLLAKDELMERSFHIRNSNTQFIGDDQNCPSAQEFGDGIVSVADVGAGGEESVVTFDGIGILTPRGRYNVELHVSFLRLQGQANDFEIQYSSLAHVSWLPKSHQPHTFVVVTLDQPIQEGQTLYPHIVMQFEADAVMETTLSMSEELYNAKYKDKLKLEHKGLVHEIFTAVLCGLSGVKVTKPGKFRSQQDGYAVKSSLKAEDGLLFPLEKGFFFLPKPPTLILHEEIDHVEFVRHTAGGSNYFNLLIKLKSDHEHFFRNIQRNEYYNLFMFIVNKGLKIMNLGTDKNTQEEGSPVLRDSLNDAADQHEAFGNESDEEALMRKKSKKEPSAPKQACAFTIFSHTEKKLGAELGDRWRKMTAEEKSRYEAKARGDENVRDSRLQ